ncbi:MAG: hypothetical protein HZA54_17360 [Planctomycetes bacterium]|nr:hypothetical protein [Planctomycetota bacterium]
MSLHPQLFHAPAARLDRPPVLHVRFDGVSRDLPLERLDLGPGASDETVRAAVARVLELSPERLAGYVVERHATGNLTVRPEAVFG